MLCCAITSDRDFNISQVMKYCVVGEGIKRHFKCLRGGEQEIGQNWLNIQVSENRSCLNVFRIKSIKMQQNLDIYVFAVVFHYDYRHY